MLLDSLFLGLLHTLTHTEIVIPYYHMVSDKSVPHVQHLYRFRSIAEFISDVDFLLDQYQPISLDDLYKAIDNSKSLPSKSFLMTFDDGFREMHDVVMPILKAKGVPAAFFVTTATVDNLSLSLYQKISLLLDERERQGPAFPEAQACDLLNASGIRGVNVERQLRMVRYEQRQVLDQLAELCQCDFNGFLLSVQPYLTSPQILRMLKEGFAVGAHSLDHPHYAELTLNEQLRQTQESAAFLRDRFGLVRVAFAFPHNDFGVSPQFFETILNKGCVSVTFGTGGLLSDKRRCHFQRFSMERTSASARLIILRQYIRRTVRQIQGQRTG